MDRSVVGKAWVESKVNVLGSKWMVQKSFKWTACESGRSQNPKVDGPEGSNMTVFRHKSGRHLLNRPLFHPETSTLTQDCPLSFVTVHFWTDRSLRLIGTVDFGPLLKIGRCQRPKIPVVRNNSFCRVFGSITIKNLWKKILICFTLLTAVMIVILFYQKWLFLIGWIGAVEAVGSEHEQKAVSCEHSRKE